MIHNLKFQVVLIFLLSPSAFVRAENCLTSTQLVELNKSIACHHLQNARDCREFYDYLESQGVGVFLSSTRDFNPTQSYWEIVAGVSALTYAITSPRIRLLVRIKSGAHKAENALREVLNAKGPSPEQISRAAQSVSALMAMLPTKTLANVSESKIVKAIGEFAKALESKTAEVVSGAKNMVGGVAVVAGNNPAVPWIGKGIGGVGTLARTGLGATVGFLGSAPMVIAFLMYELDNYNVERIEKKTKCTAEHRNRFPYLCYKETCWFHHTNCEKAFNFIILNSLDAQMDFLNARDPGQPSTQKDSILCQYMKEQLSLAPAQLENVVLDSCNEDQALKYTINHFQPSDLSISSLDTGWTKTSEDYSVTVSSAFNETMDRPESATVKILPGINHNGYKMQNLLYRYGDSGDLLTVSMDMADYMPWTTTPSRWAPPRDLDHLKRLMSPANDVGLFARLRKGGWNAKSRWIYEQQYLLHKRMTQIHAEAVRCCNPESGKPCRLKRAEGSGSAVLPDGSIQ